MSEPKEELKLSIFDEENRITGKPLSHFREIIRNSSEGIKTREAIEKKKEAFSSGDWENPAGAGNNILINTRDD